MLLRRVGNRFPIASCAVLVLLRRLWTSCMHCWGRLLSRHHQLDKQRLHFATSRVPARPHFRARTWQLMMRRQLRQVVQVSAYGTARVRLHACCFSVSLVKQLYLQVVCVDCAYSICIKARSYECKKSISSFRCLSNYSMCTWIDGQLWFWA